MSIPSNAGSRDRGPELATPARGGPAAAVLPPATDDLAIPPSSLPPASDATSAGDSSACAVEQAGGGHASGPGRLRSLARRVVLAGAVAFASWATWSVLSEAMTVETRHDNWSHVEAAAEQTVTMDRDAMTFVKKDGTPAPVVILNLTQNDLDVATTNAITGALEDGASASAQEILRSAQDIPQVALANTGEPLGVAPAPDVVVAPADPDVAAEPSDPLASAPAAEDPTVPVEPVLTSGMCADIHSGDQGMYHLFLFDSCDEDGDVVTVIINGQPFATVPITHAGATLSVPLAFGSSNTIELFGLRDGGGGITVSFETSEGHYFCRDMLEGETQTIGAVTR